MAEASGTRVPVALDGHGADAGPELVMEGAALAAADGIAVRVFGPPGIDPADGVELVECREWIGNEAEPVAAVRSTPDASVVRAAAAVAAGEAGAVVSAGSTGATMTAALFALRRIRGVHRPALAAQVPVPGEERTVLFLDAGANTESRPQHLVQFAFMGSAFAEAVLGIDRPRVALLSVGEEQKKGNPDVVAAHERLAASEGIEFAGNVEGRDLLTGAADVIVTDGFTGNVTLKTLEGTARAVGDAVRSAARSGPVAAAGGLLLRPALGGLRASMDPNGVGGAILLGLRGVAVVAHGSSSAEGIANAVRLADSAVRERAVERMGALLESSDATRDALRERRPTRDNRPMDRDEVLTLVRDHLVAELEVAPEKVKPETRFREDLDADSLDLYELLMELEDRYGIRVSEEEAAGIETVDDAVGFVCARVPAS